MQTQRSAYKEIEDLLEKVRPPRMALVEQRWVGEKETGCQVRATMEAVLLGETASGIEVSSQTL